MELKRIDNAFIHRFDCIYLRCFWMNRRKTCVDAEVIGCAFEQLTNSTESIRRARVCPRRRRRSRLPIWCSWERLFSITRSPLSSRSFLSGRDKFEYVTHDIDHIVKSSPTYLNREQDKRIYSRTTCVDHGLSYGNERCNVNIIMSICSRENHVRYPLDPIRHSLRKHLIDPQYHQQSSSLLKQTELPLASGHLWSEDRAQSDLIHQTTKIRISRYSFVYPEK